MNTDNINYLKLPLVIGISGASGTIYGMRLLQFLLENSYKVELVVSDGALKVASDELSLNFSTNIIEFKKQVLSYLNTFSNKNIDSDSGIKDFDSLRVWPNSDISASIASGSFRTLGMIIIPASMGTVAAIANGISNNLITRAADVCLKERRKLVLVPREMPLSEIHLENMLKLTRAGAVISPASPAFYHNPASVMELVDFVVGKALDLFGINNLLFKRWKESSLLKVLK